MAKRANESYPDGTVIYTTEEIDRLVQKTRDFLHRYNFGVLSGQVRRLDLLNAHRPRMDKEITTLCYELGPPLMRDRMAQNRARAVRAGQVDKTSKAR